MLRSFVLVCGLCSLALGVARGQVAAAPDAVESRVESLLAQLTVEEKLDLLGGVDGFFTKPIPRLNIPRLKMMDGPVGTRNDGESTAYPAGIMLAASWNTQLAGEMGAAIGRDARARGCHIVLGPAMNIYRVPVNGRNFEYLGEDPFLAGRMAVDYTRGMQAQGVAACAKHYAANNQEESRGHVNVVMDERTLHEIYLPAFKAAVQEGGVWTVMSAYNRLNGPYCTASDYLQNQVLRGQWGFKGLVMSDWGATHETLNCVTGGLDLEMPSGAHLSREKILPLLRDGRVVQGTIDEKVRRLLRVMVSMGFLDREQKLEGVALNDEKGVETALEVAREGVVLLKNEGGILPLEAAKVRSIAVIGANADPAVTGGGGSSYVQPTKALSVVDGLRAVFGGEVRHVAASQARDLERARAYTKFGGRVSASYFANTELRGKPVVVREESTVDFDWRDKSPAEGVPANDFSVRFAGAIVPEKGGSHTFYVRADDGFRLKLDGKTILEDWTNHGAYTARVLRDLEAGREYEVQLEYYNGKGLAEVRLAYLPTPEPFDAGEREMIRSADAVVACIGFSPRTEGEGYDRAYELPAEQVSLLREGLALNRKLVVVLNAGGSVEFNGWVDEVPGLLHAWYPGQEGGRAIAEILLGKIGPSGKLPISIERKREDQASFGRYPGRDGHVEYSEGIFVGYRHFDHAGIAPRFPFGFGLSYSTFEISSPQVVQDGDGWRVAVDVSNTGKVAGAEVVQLYVSAEKAAVVRAEKELKGFAKVRLEPGAKRRVEIPLKREALRRYDVVKHGWVVDPGNYVLRVGTSSRDLPLSLNIEVQ